MKNIELEILKSIKFKLINWGFFVKENRISLEKNNDYSNIIVKINKNNLDFAGNVSDINKFEEIVKNFLTTLHNKSKNFSVEVFLENYKKTKFNIYTDSDKKGGFYYPGVRSCTYQIHTYDVSNHELLHLSSANLKNDFGIYSKGLDEGYTSLLAERYFGEKTSDDYIFFKNIMLILERIVGGNRMEKFYFNADVLGLINELKKYTTMEEIDGFFLLWIEKYCQIIGL